MLLLNIIYTSKLNLINNKLHTTVLYTSNNFNFNIGFSSFINLYFNNFLSHKIGQKSILLFNNLNLIFNSTNNYLNLLKRKLIRNKNYPTTSFNNLINCLLLSFYLKDSFIFVKNIVSLFEGTFYKNHRKLLVMLRYIFKTSINLFYFFNILGILFRIKGKIGLGGNSKKRRTKLIFHKLKLNNKNIKLCYSNTIIRTDSGVLGVNFLLTYS